MECFYLHLSNKCVKIKKNPQFKTVVLAVQKKALKTQNESVAYYYAMRWSGSTR